MPIDQAMREARRTFLAAICREIEAVGAKYQLNLTTLKLTEQHIYTQAQYKFRLLEEPAVLKIGRVIFDRDRESIELRVFLPRSEVRRESCLALQLMGRRQDVLAAIDGFFFMRLAG